MTNEEQEWLDGLRGKARATSSSDEQLLAASVRNALISRRKSIEADSLNFEPEKLELIRRKLIDKDLIVLEQKTRKVSPFFDFVLGLVSVKSGQAAIQKVGILAIVLFIGFALRDSYMSKPNENQMLYRGDGSEAYIFDDNPDSKLISIVSELELLKAEFTTEKLSYGRTLVKIKFTQDTKDYLEKKKIQVQEVNGFYSIVISPPKAKLSK
jgi:hypothetical protein